jgi:hypothetical protein
MTMQSARVRKSGAAFCCSIALLLLGAACGQQQPADTRVADGDTIRNLDTQWSKAASSRNVEGTIAFYADDASVLPPNGPIVDSRLVGRTAWPHHFAFVAADQGGGRAVQRYGVHDRHVSTDDERCAGQTHDG